MSSETDSSAGELTYPRLAHLFIHIEYIPRKQQQQQRQRMEVI